MRAWTAPKARRVKGPHMKVDQADQLSADLESGWTLPSSWYHDAEIYELERRRIFERPAGST